MFTFLHTRKFLSYHGRKFEDQSLIFFGKHSKIVGVLPAARHPRQSDLVVSHPGLTFGGLLHPGALAGEEMLIAFEHIFSFYREQGFKHLRYKSVPWIYTSRPSEDDEYALFRKGAKLERCDLSSCVDIQHGIHLSERRARCLKKASSHSLTISRENAAEGFWPLLIETLKQRHSVQPVHTSQEIAYLQIQFPENIDIRVALDKTEIVAGLVLFKTPRVTHVQYSACSKRGRELSALDFLLANVLEEAALEHKRFFDFGICTEQEGQTLNSGLYAYKSEFGGGGFAYKHFSVSF